MRVPLGIAGVLLLTATPLAAQTSGAIAGRVRDALTGEAVRAALIRVDGGRQGAATDTVGAYRVREVRAVYSADRTAIRNDRAAIRADSADATKLAADQAQLAVDQAKLTADLAPLKIKLQSKREGAVAGEHSESLHLA